MYISCINRTNKFAFDCCYSIIIWTAATNSEVSERRRRDDAEQQGPVRHTTAVAILNRCGPQQGSRSTLASDLPWGRGWGWATLPNGVWIGGKQNCTIHFRIIYYMNKYIII